MKLNGLYYVVRCNKYQNRYLGFDNKINKKRQDPERLALGQTEPSDLSHALLFTTEELAENAKALYRDNSTMDEKYKANLLVLHTNADPNADYITAKTDLGFGAYIDRDAFNRYNNA